MKHWQAGCVVLLAAVLPASTAGAERAPVLVELFTSEGSANCLPADQLLARLDATAIVLGEHVTNWDGRAWRDRFSLEELTKRQQAYVDRFRLDSAYAPQMVVNGTVQFSGSDSARASAEIAKAAKRVKVEPRLLWTDTGVQVEIDGAHVGDRVFLALADESATTTVTGGENKGRQLHHVVVCREIRKAGTVPIGGAFYQLIKLPPQARKQRAILWIQVGEVGAVAGATMLPPADQQ
jgi:hypothetical protein